MFRIVVAGSEDPSSIDAVYELLADAINKLNGENPSAGILYAGIDHEHSIVLNEIMTKFPELELIGCTTAGEMSSSNGMQEDSLSLILFVSDEVEIAGGVVKEITSEKESILKQLSDVEQKLTKQKKLCITLPESLSLGGNFILHHLKEAYGSEFPILGGTSGEHIWSVQKTYQFYKTEVLTNSIPVLLFSEPLKFSFGVATGRTPVGKKLTVTSAKGNIVETIDEKPAIEFYKYYLGSFMDEDKIYNQLANFSAAIFERDSKFYLRAPLNYNSENGHMTFMGDVPEGASIQLTEATRESILSGVRESSAKAIKHYPGESPSATLLFSCAGRKVKLGVMTEKEIQLLENTIPGNPDIAGFYCFGEFAPLEPNSESKFHNETFVILLMGV